LEIKAHQFIGMLICEKDDMGKMKLTREDVISYMENFLANKGEAHDWDDFISIPIDDAELDLIRDRCAQLPEEFPPVSKNQYCGPAGQAVLMTFLKQLKS